ncbi:EAL domain-containing protein [Rhodocyclus gracilis]|uniref:EAL domain-containing protein n=1 Tax=Rhodocyclus tenuis TaxID=1066 RepID=A0A6L5JSM0_RHOTE|nr:EAL domain-containing protein [Rhodocyclus gracilis]MQY50363.1 EAL domain-containing protein [Rhodocyclus gracilis]
MKTPKPTPARVVRRILEVADTGMLAVDAHGIILEANTSLCQMFGYTRDELVGQSVGRLLPADLRAAHSRYVRDFANAAESERSMRGRGELTGCRKDGSCFPLKASLSKYRENGDWILLASLHDFSEQKQAEEERVWQATHDALTGLPNRALIRERLANALDRSSRHGRSVAVLFVDLDGFKPINDSYGYDSGDALLKQAAATLEAQLRPDDSLARMSGDEFVILCEQIDDPVAMSTLAQRLNEQLRQPFVVNAQEVFIAASIGVAIGDGAKHSADEMLRDADAAMFAVKRQGGDGWRFFSGDLHEEARQRLVLTRGLRVALERDEFSVLFQPIVSVTSGRVAGAEVLLRWTPSDGPVSPAVFIPVAEKTGAIIPIGAWVFRQACLAAARWATIFGEAVPYLSVNVSTRQLDDPALADVFEATLRETGADPSRIVIEITETALMDDVDANLRMLRRLAELGLRAAVDDFGTGYSSLAQLLRMPVSLLKIDREFIDGLDKRRDSRIITSTVIGMGHSLGMRLVAEGVETAAQLAELSAHGCDYVQGFYFHRPLAEEAFIDIVRREIAPFLTAPDDPLYFLVYVSEAVTPLDRAALAQLLDTSRQRNAALGVTGILLYQHGCFMQMLEGRRSVVEGLIAKIYRDPRHHTVRISARGALSRRIFPEWSMGFRDMSELPGTPDFDNWRQRTQELLALADDPATSFAFLAAFAQPLNPPVGLPA